MKRLAKKEVKNKQATEQRMTESMSQKINMREIRLGITIHGEKVILGMTECNTENYQVCREFLNNLIERGLSSEEPLLVVIDGGKGLKKAVDVVFGQRAFVQRCQWHKRENVASYLSKDDQAEWRRRLQSAYEKPGYDAARKQLLSLRKDLAGINISAANSLDEGFEETLTHENNH